MNPGGSTARARASHPHARTECPVCGAACGEPFLELAQLPVFCNLLWQTVEEARRAPRADLALSGCGACGHIFNPRFDANLATYQPAYENSLHFSGRFSAYARELAASLAERHGLRGKRVIDVGCGNGDFLELVCGLANAEGIGFDPACRRESEGENGIRFVRGYYRDGAVEGGADLISCRQVLEHVAEPRRMLEALRPRADSGSNPLFFFEVPNAELLVREAGIWDFIYEHCGYFTRSSLRALFERCGFEVLRIDTAFEGQYLHLEARYTGRAEARSPHNGRGKDLGGFAARSRQRIEEWQARLAAERPQERIVIWGAGSKGVTFLNLVDRGGRVLAVADINPRKHGRFVPGTGHCVVAPERLREERPSRIIVMNPIYSAEIAGHLARLGIEAEIQPV